MRVGHFGFVSFDDPDYVTQNPFVQAGLTWTTLRWAFTSTAMANWHPLTWISLAADVSVFGTQPGAHHLVNLLIHVINTLLCFHLLKRMTRQLWPSAIVSALFALHPLHVESVAWIAERKDVLSMLFWILTTLAYVNYVRKPAFLQYLFVTVLFATGLLAKPMLVTLPATLLLLDFWPLRRIEFDRKPIKAGLIRFTGLVVEKLPLFSLALASSVMTLIAQRGVGAVVELARLPLSLRIANAVFSVVSYIQKMVWPTKLAVFYPHPSDSLGLTFPLSMGTALIAITGMVVYLGKRMPYLVTGWFWYVITLMPVIGLIQVGSQGMADRYTYIPLLGLFIMVVWSGNEAAQRWRIPNWIVGCTTGLVIAGLSVLTYLQVGHWQNTISLFSHAARVTRGNWLAHERLAEAYYEQGNYQEAILESEQALQIVGFRSSNRIRIGDAQMKLGHKHEALVAYLSASATNPQYLVPEFNAACILVEIGRTDEAMDHFRRVINAKPGQLGSDLIFVRSASMHARITLGIILRNRGQKEDARVIFEDALRIEPHDIKAALNLGLTLSDLGKHEAALATIRQCLELDPANLGVQYFYGCVLRDAGHIPQAQEVFKQLLLNDPRIELAQTALGALPRSQGVSR